MHPAVASHRDAIIELCRRHHVSRLDVFGSATTADFDPQRSDVDLLVEFFRDGPGMTMRNYFSLKEELEALLGRQVDLVEPGGVRNEYYWKGINATREAFYAAA